MITRLQTFFLKHNKWLFSVLLVVIIVTFVLTIGNQSFFGSGAARTVETREYYGYNLNDPQDQQQLVQNASISAQLHPELGIQGAAVSQYALMRVAALGLANELNIQGPNENQLRRYLESLELFQGEEGSFNAERYTQFRDFVAARMGGERPLAKVLREDYRIAQVRDALSGPGYVVPFAMQKLYAQSETDWEVAVANRDYSDFQPELDPEEETLRSFYERDAARFAIPERLKLSAVRFRADNFLDRVPEPSEGDLQNYFQRYQFRYQPEPTEGEEEAPAVELEDVREQVAADYRREQARQLAQDASDLFLSRIYEQEIERDSEAFTEAVDEFGGRVESIPPYARGEAPRNLGINPQSLQSMWIYRSGDRYYSDLSATQDGAALLVRDELIPERIPPFEEVAAQVEQAWTAEERRRLFAEAAREWERQIDQALSEGTDFAAAAEAAGFTVETPDGFTGGEPPMELRRLQLASELPGLETGERSPVVLSDNAAALLFVTSKSVPEVDASSEGYNTFLEEQVQIRQENNGWAAIGAWTEQTLQVATPDIQQQG